MNISDYKSDKQNYIDYLADFILFQFPADSISKIEVAECENFILVKGKTSSKDLINLSEVRDKFLKENNFEILNLSKTIDLIDYGVDMSEEQIRTFHFHNTTNPSESVCNSSEIEKNEKLITVSSFPHGYSFRAGRGLYYLAKNITYNLQLKSVWNNLKIVISNENNDERFQIYSDCTEIQDEMLRSAILDCFDFNLEAIEKNFRKSDWLQNTKNKSELEFVKKINSELIIF